MKERIFIATFVGIIVSVFFQLGINVSMFEGQISLWWMIPVFIFTALGYCWMDIYFDDENLWK